MINRVFSSLSSRLKQSALFHDSFWAVFGNGLGYAMLLLAGVLIARLLGRDLYGEYGVAKTNMLYIAGFATFGMGFTSTKFIAQSQEQDRAHLCSLIRDAQLISFLFSLCVALLVAVFARPLATYLEEPGLTLCFRMLSLIIVAKSFCTTQTGILSGLKRFQDIAVNSMISGGAMLLLCVVLTYWFGLAGALTSLLLSQVVNVLANAVSIRRVERTFGPQSAVNRRLELVRFSFPIALQESSFSLCNWLAILLLTKYSSVGEVGLYTASAQWNAIITIIPGLLVNVILAHLAGSMSDRTVHKRTLHTMLGVNFLCTLLPFAVVYVLASYISSFYGPDFVGMPPVLRVLTFVAIFDCCSQVFRSEFIAQGLPWTVFLIRLSRDVLLVMLVLLLLQHSGGEHGAVRYATALVVASAFHFVMLLLVYWWKSSFLVHKES